MTETGVTFESAKVDQPYLWSGASEEEVLASLANGYPDLGAERAMEWLLRAGTIHTQEAIFRTSAAAERDDRLGEAVRLLRDGMHEASEIVAQLEEVQSSLAERFPDTSADQDLEDTIDALKLPDYFSEDVDRLEGLEMRWSPEPRDDGQLLPNVPIFILTVADLESIYNDVVEDVTGEPTDPEMSPWSRLGPQDQQRLLEVAENALEYLDWRAVLVNPVREARRSLGG